MTAGGTNDVRGWGDRQLGPKVPDIEANIQGTDTVYTADRYAPIGALAKISGGLELRFPAPGMSPAWRAHLFLDGGRVWTPDERFSQSLLLPQDTPFRFSIGTGLSYQTPVGALGLYLGYKLNPSNLDARRSRQGARRVPRRDPDGQRGDRLDEAPTPAPLVRGRAVSSVHCVPAPLQARGHRLAERGHGGLALCDRLLLSLLLRLGLGLVGLPPAPDTTSGRPDRRSRPGVSRDRADHRSGGGTLGSTFTPAPPDAGIRLRLGGLPCGVGIDRYGSGIDSGLLLRPIVAGLLVLHSLRVGLTLRCIHRQAHLRRELGIVDRRGGSGGSRLGVGGGLARRGSCSGAGFVGRGRLRGLRLRGRGRGGLPIPPARARRC